MAVEDIHNGVLGVSLPQCLNMEENAALTMITPHLFDALPQKSTNK